MIVYIVDCNEECKNDILDDFILSQLKVALSQKVQDSFFIARIDRKNIPKNYLKLLHPLHSIDKMSIFKKFTFTCLIYLQV